MSADAWQITDCKMTKGIFNLLATIQASNHLSQFIYTAFARRLVLLQMITKNFFFQERSDGVAPPPKICLIKPLILHSETVSFQTDTVSDNLNPSPFQITYNLILTLHRLFCKIHKHAI